MRQTLLSQYFDIPPRPTPTGLSFLDLPYTSRHRIYVLAGLVRTPCAIDLNREAQDRDVRDDNGPARRVRCIWRDTGAPFPDPAARWDEDDIDCGCPPLPVALLYTSHEVSKECVHVLYSENKFKICHSRHRGLLPLQGLGGAALESLTSLTVRLNRCPCRLPLAGRAAPRPSDYHVDCKGGCPRGGDKPLAGISRNDKAVLSNWRSACAKLAAGIRPSRLRLFVVCDTASYEVAQHVVAPLSALPVLCACAVRLGQVPDDRLRRLAETTVRRLTAQSLPGASAGGLTPPSPARRLPLEILRRVWHFTDLTAPRHLLWEESHGLRPSPCDGHCTDAREACCCPVYHAAFSSSPCVASCWRLPTGLFLVSRALRSEAERLFYGRNHFVLLPLGTIYFEPAVVECGAPPSLHAFLRAVPARCVRHLRSLEVVFPGVDSGLFVESGSGAIAPTVRRWARGVELLVALHGAALPELALTLNLSSQRIITAETGYMSTERMDGIETKARLLYRCVLGQLADSLQSQTHAQTPALPRERPLRDLFVYLSWPLAFDKRSEQDRAERERESETLVMGAGYDATSRGKFVMDAWGGFTNIEWS